MIKKEITKNKSLKMSLALVAIGVLLVLGCPASSNSTGGPDDGGDTTAPSFDSSSSVPAADATDFPANSNIILTYSEAVQAGTGNITITPSGGAAITIAVGDAQVTIAGAVVTINPTNDLAVSTTYTLTIPAGAFMDAAGNMTAEATLSFSTAAVLDTTAPTLQSTNPAAGSTSFSADANIMLTYNEPVQAGTGNIIITPSGGAAITIAVGDAQVTIAGAVVTINPTNNLTMSTTYTLTVPAGAIVDASGNAGSMVTLSFSTAAALDETGPTVSSSVPVADGTNFPIDLPTFTLTFSEAVQAGTGDITITPSGGNAITIAVSNAQVSISGAVVMVNLLVNLQADTTYALSFVSGVFVSSDDQTPAPAFSLDFTTLDTTAPTFSSSVPAADATDINASLNIILTYNEPVQAGTGNITITPSGGAAITIAVGDAQVSIAGAVVTINPTNSLAVSTTYTLTVADGAIVDASGNAGSMVTLSFSTAANIVPVVISSVPVADGIFNTKITTSLVLTFSTAVVKGSGSIFIRRLGITRIEVPIGSTNVNISGAVVTINNPFSWVENSAYIMSFAAGGFVSSADRTPAPAFSLDFTTDTTSPTLSSSVPAADVIVLTYNEPVQAGTGNITLTPMGGTPLTIPVSSAQVSFSGAVVTIDPSANLELSTEYNLAIPAGAFTDTSGNQAPELTLSFTTAALLVPRVISSVPAEGETLDVSNEGSIIRLTYNQVIVKGSGNIVLTTSNSGSAMVEIGVNDAEVSISGNVVSIDISGFSSRSALAGRLSYGLGLVVPVTAFTNADGNNPLSQFALTVQVLLR